MSTVFAKNDKKNTHANEVRVQTYIEYNQEMPQPHATDQPMAPSGRHTEQ